MVETIELLYCLRDNGTTDFGLKQRNVVQE